MRKPISSWRDTLTRFGFKARRGSKGCSRPKPRSLQLESLESRQLLTTNLVITGFSGDGADLAVDYDIADSNATAFDIGIYRSADGDTATPDTLLLTERISDSGDLTVGPHSVSITADFSSAAEDYFLVAVLDDSLEVTETNESDNEQAFDGGTFLAVDGTVHVHGPDSDDADTVTLSLSTTVDVTLNGVTDSFTTGDVAALEVRTHGGNDTITSQLSGSKDVTVFGGGQTDGDDMALLYGLADYYDEFVAYPTHATLTTVGATTTTIEVYDVEDTRAWAYSGTGDTDLAKLYAADGQADQLTSRPDDGYTLLKSGDDPQVDFYLRAEGFSNVWGIGNEDDDDLALMFGTSGDDNVTCKLYEERATFTMLAGTNDYRTNAKEFKEFSVHGSGGFDKALLWGGDSWSDPGISGDDTLTVTPRYAYSWLTMDATIETSLTDTTAFVRGFEEVHGYVKGVKGRGEDHATVYGTEEDDEMELDLDYITRTLHMPQNRLVELHGFDDAHVDATAENTGYDRIYVDLCDGDYTLDQVSGEHAVSFSNGVDITDKLSGFEYAEGNPDGTGSEVRLALDAIDDQPGYEDMDDTDVVVPVAQGGPALSGGAVSYNSNTSLLTATLLDPTTTPEVHLHLKTDQFGDAIITAESDYDDGTKVFSSFNLAVEPVPDPPEIEVNAGLTVAEGTTSIITTLELSAWDVDDDPPALTYTVTTGCSQGRLELSTDPGIAISSFTQADLAAGLVRYVHDGSEPVAESFQFDLQDDDLLGPTGQTFTITVTPVNDPPEVSSDVFEVEYRSVKGTVVGQVVAENPEPEQTLYYEITGGDPNGVFAIDGEEGLITVANGSLLVFEEARGYTLSVTVTDDGEPPASGSGTVDVTLTSTPWVQDPIADHDFPADQTELRIRLADVFFEPDDQSQLTYGFVTENGALFSVAEEGEGDDRELVVTRLSDDSGTALITVTATNQPAGHSSSTIFQVSYNETLEVVDDGPNVVWPIPDQVFAEDTTPASIDLSAHFGDSDGDALAFSITGIEVLSLGPVGVEGATLLENTPGALAGSQLALGLTADRFGRAVVTVRAEDPEGQSVTDTFHVTVLPVDEDPEADPPQVSCDLDEDGEPLVVDLSDCFADDTLASGDDLFLSVHNPNPEVVRAVPVGMSVELTPMPDQNTDDFPGGTMPLTVTASDGGGHSADFTLDVRISPANDPVAALAATYDVTVLEDAGDYTIYWYDLFEDIDTERTAPTEELSFVVGPPGDPGLVTVTQETGGGVPRFVLDFGDNENGTTNFTITATDPGPDPATVTVNVDVQPVNDRPFRTAAPLPEPLPYNASFAPNPISLAGLFDDVEDGTGLTLEAYVTSGNADVFSSLSVVSDELQFALNPATSGTATVTVLAVDSLHLPSGERASFDVTVNDPVRVWVVENATVTLDVEQDLDFHLDAVTGYALLEDPAPPPGATLTDGLFSWTPGESHGGGQYEAHIKASNADSDTSIVTIEIDVLEDNHPPEFTSVCGQAVAPGATSVEVTIDELTELSFPLVATDPDDPAQQLTFKLPDPPSVPGLEFDDVTGCYTWTPTEFDGPGDYTLPFVVFDPAGASDNISINVHVNEVNTPPVVEGVRDLSVPGVYYHYCGWFGDDTDETLLFIRDEDYPRNDFQLSINPEAEGISIASSAEVPGWRTLDEGGYVLRATGDPQTWGLSQTVTLSVSDGIDTVQQQFDVTFDPPVLGSFDFLTSPYLGQSNIWDVTFDLDQALPAEESMIAYDNGFTVGDVQWSLHDIPPSLADRVSIFPDYTYGEPPRGELIYQPAAADVGTHWFGVRETSPDWAAVYSQEDFCLRVGYSQTVAEEPYYESFMPSVAWDDFERCSSAASPVGVPITANDAPGYHYGPGIPEDPYLGCTVEVVSAPTQGTVTLVQDPYCGFQYATYQASDPNFVGYDAFTYRLIAHQGNVVSNTATATIVVGEPTVDFQVNAVYAEDKVAIPLNEHWNEQGSQANLPLQDAVNPGVSDGDSDLVTGTLTIHNPWPWTLVGYWNVSCYTPLYHTGRVTVNAAGEDSGLTQAKREVSIAPGETLAIPVVLEGVESGTCTLEGGFETFALMPESHVCTGTGWSAFEWENFDLSVVMANLKMADDGSHGLYYEGDYWPTDCRKEEEDPGFLLMWNGTPDPLGPGAEAMNIELEVAPCSSYDWALDFPASLQVWEVTQSGYDPVVSGTRESHASGTAIDFYVEGISPTGDDPATLTATCWPLDQGVDMGVMVDDLMKYTVADVDLAIPSISEENEDSIAGLMASRGLMPDDGSNVLPATLTLQGGNQGKFWIEVVTDNPWDPPLRVVKEQDGLEVPTNRGDAEAISFDTTQTINLRIVGRQEGENVSLVAHYVPDDFDLRLRRDAAIIDSVLVTLIDLDVDVDSDNNGTIGDRVPHSGEPVYYDEDSIEADPTKPGKYVPVNDHDTDGDAVVDFADFDHESGFVTMQVNIPSSCANDAVVRFTYEHEPASDHASDPGGVTPKDDGDGTYYEPAAGTMRIWKPPLPEHSRNPLPANQGGDYIAHLGEYTLTELGFTGPGSWPLYVEGIAPSSVMGDELVTVEIDPDGTVGNQPFCLKDAVRLTVVWADIDVDSDNDGTIDPGDYSYEDQTEDLTADGRFGKVVYANRGDLDYDFVPDFADGIRIHGNEDDDASAGFAEVHLAIGGGLDPDVAVVRLDYNGSDPAGITYDAQTGIYGLPDGGGPLRLWTKNGSQSRNPLDVHVGGDYVTPGQLYRASDLGLDSQDPVSFYLEAVCGDPAIQTITLAVDPDGFTGPAGFMATDAVIVSAIAIDLSILDLPDQREYYDPEEGTGGSGDEFWGQVIHVNDGDCDVDGVPDFADGLNMYDNEGAGASEAFTAVSLGLTGPQAVWDQGNLLFEYSGSNPAGLVRNDVEPPYHHTYEQGEAPYFGSLRLWCKDGSEDRSVSDLGLEGDYITPDMQYAVAGVPTNLYLEGLCASNDAADQPIKVSFNLDPAPGSPDAVLMDAISITVVQADLDVDTDNTATIDHTLLEDQFEAMQETADNGIEPADFPGRLVPVNHGDTDWDGIPDFADWHGDHEFNPSQAFTLAELSIPTAIDPGKATVRFHYEASDPLDAEQTFVDRRIHYTPASGSLRLWNVDGTGDRSPLAVGESGGNYLAPNIHYALGNLELQTPEEPLFNLYVEGIRTSLAWADQLLVVYLDPDGPDGPLGEEALDEVRFTVIGSTEVAIAATNAYASEDAGDGAAFTISRPEGNVLGDLTVYYSIDTTLPDAAGYGTDYTASVPGVEGSVTIPDGYSSVTVLITPIDEEEVEWDERIVMSLVAGDSPGSDPDVPYQYTINPNAETAAVTILDNDGLEVAIDPNADVVSTGEAPAVQSDGLVIAGIQQGDVSLGVALGTSAYSPVYVGNAGAYPIVLIDARFPSLADVDNVTAEFRFADCAPQTLHYDLSGYDGSSALRFGFPADARALETGQYDYDVTFVAAGTSQTSTRTFRGAFPVVNRLDGPDVPNRFGSGWWVPGLDEIVPYDGVLFDPAATYAPADQLDTTYRLALQGAATRTGAAVVRSDSSAGWFSARYDRSGVAGLVDDALLGSTTDYAEEGVWTWGTAEAGFRKDYRATQSSTATATWTLRDLDPNRTYQLYVTWVPGLDRDSAAKYTVSDVVRLRDPGAVNPAVTVDQRYVPGETFFSETSDTPWRSLGFFKPACSGDVEVQLQGSGGGLTVADGVLVVGHWEFDTPDGSFSTLAYNDRNDAGQPAGQFQLRDKFGTYKLFDADGVMTDAYDRFENHTQFAYQSGVYREYLDTVTTQTGLTTQFAYDGQRLSTVTDFAGRLTTYSDEGSQCTVELPSPGYDQPISVWAIGENTDHMLSLVQDPNGNVTTLDYYGNRRVRQVNLHSVHGVDAHWRMISETTRSWVGQGPFSANGDPPVDPAAGGVVTPAKPGDVEALYTDPNGNAWTYRTDAYGYVTSMTNPAPFEDTWVWQRNQHGLVTLHSQPGGYGWIDNDEDGQLDTDLPRIDTAFTEYDANGNLKSVTYADNTKETWEYDEHFSQATKYQFHVSSGTVIRETIYGLNSRGAPISVTEKDKFLILPDRVTESAYTPAPTQIGQMPGGLVLYTKSPAGTTDEVTTVTKYYRSGPELGLVKTVTYAFDTAVRAKVAFQYDANLNPSRTEDEANRPTQYVYDALDRLIEVREASPGTSDHGPPTTLYRYDGVGNQVRVRDANGNWTDYQYDERNRLEKVQLPAPGGHAQTDQTRPETLYVYDDNNNLTFENVLKPQGGYYVTEHRYDERNFQTITLMPDPGTPQGESPAPEAEKQPIFRYGYDALGNVAWDSDPRYTLDSTAGLPPVVTTYEYDAFARLRKITQPDEVFGADPSGEGGVSISPVTEYVYADTGELLELHAPGPNVDASDNQVVTRFRYDGFGRLTAEISPADDTGLHLITQYVYDLRDNVKHVYVFGGGVNDDAYQPGDDLDQPGDPPTTITTDVRHTHNYYDFRDRLIASDVSGFRQETPGAWTEHDGTVTVYAYNMATDVLGELLAPGSFSSNLRTQDDGLSYFTTLGGLRIAQGVSWDSDIDSRLSEYEYDGLGRVKVAKGPDPDAWGGGSSINPDLEKSFPPVETEFTYDPAGNQVKVTLRWSDLHDDSGTPVRVSHELDTDTEFDNLDRPYHVLGPYVPADGPATLTTPEQFISYQVDGTVFGTLVKNSSEGFVQWRNTFYEYDAAGRLWKTSVDDDAKYDGTAETYTYFDAAGNVVRTVDPWFLDESRCLLETDNEYDNLGRLTKTKREMSEALEDTDFEMQLRKRNVYQETNFGYNLDGTLRLQYQTSSGGTVPAGSSGVVEYQRDPLGRVRTQSTELHPDSTAVTTSTYDVFGNVLSLTDANDNVTLFTYDWAGRRVQDAIEGDFDGDGTSDGPYLRNYYYDALGNLNYTIDRNGRTTGYEYNNAGWRMRESWYGTESPDRNDPAAEAAAADLLYSAEFERTGLGELAQASDEYEGPYEELTFGPSAFDFAYDAQRRVTNVSQPDNSQLDNSVDFVYEYDLLGNLTRSRVLIGYLEDFDVHYTYDNQNRVTRVQQTGPEITPKTIAYDYHFSRMADNYAPVFHTTIQRYGNASGSGAPVVTTERYDYPDGRANKISHFRGGDPVGSKLIRGYTTYYDSLGRMNFKAQTCYTTEVVTTERKIYEYDDHGRLLSVTDETGHVEDFEYDDTGNPLVEDQQNVGAHNRLLFDANAFYSYDPEGNLGQRWDLDTFLLDAVDAVLTSSDLARSEQSVDWLEFSPYRALLEGLEFSVGQVFSDPDYSTIELTLCIYDYNGGQPIDVEVDQIDVPLVPHSSGGQTVYRPDCNVLSVFSLDGGNYPDGEFAINWCADGWDADLEPGAQFTVQRMGRLREFTWDHRNRLISVTGYHIDGFSDTEGMDLPGSAGRKALVTESDFIKYQYDVMDNLVSKQSGRSGDFPTIEAYVVSLGHRVIDFRDAPDEEREIRQRLYAPGVDTLLAVDRRTENAAGDPTAATVVWTLTDYQGSLGDLASSVSEQHVDYTAYGVPDGPNYGLASYVDTFYAGRDYDRDTALYHNRGRWFDPAATRFLSEDPIGFAGGDANLYRYAGNAPSMATDARHTKSQPSQSSEFWSNFAELYGWYLNPLHNDPGDDWTFGAGKLLGWGMFVVGSAGWGIGAGGAALGGTSFAYSASTTMALAGGTAAAMQVHAANSNAGPHQYAFSVGLGAAFGGRFPTVGLWDFGGTVAGGGVEWAAGGDFYGRGMQWGGLAGTIAGGGLTHGWRMAAWETGGALAGAGLGYGVYGTPEGALLGAYAGTLAGGLAHSASGAYRRVRASHNSIVLNSARRNAWRSSFGKPSAGLGQLVRKLPKGHQARRNLARMIREIRASGGAVSSKGLRGRTYGQFTAMEGGRTGLFRYQPSKLRIADFLEEQVHWQQIKTGQHLRSYAGQSTTDVMEILAKQRVLQHPDLTPVLRAEWLDDLARIRAGRYGR